MKMLGSRIAVLRRASGLSQGELANRLQVSPSAVGMYEQGRREPSAEILVNLSRVLGVSVDYLLTGRATPTEQEAVTEAMDAALSQAKAMLRQRPDRPFSRKELAVLFAALLLEE